MDLVSALQDVVPLLIVTLGGGWLLNHRLDRLERSVDTLPTREEMHAGFQSGQSGLDGLRAEMQAGLQSGQTGLDGLRAEMRMGFEGQGKRLDRLETEVAGLRSDLTQIALAVGARARPQTG